MDDSNRRAWIEVDLSAIAANTRRVVESLGPGVELCAVVKADAYGHGATAVAREALAAGASSLAVAIVSEGVELRQAGFSSPILVLGAMPPGQASTIVDYDLTTPVFTMRGAEALSRAASACGKTARVHLKVDTGMGRIGCAPDEAPRLAMAISSLPGLELSGCFSHFFDAENPARDSASRQLRVFNEVCAEIEARGIRLPTRHIANSAAALSFPESRLDMVRVGLALYGLSPFGEREVPGLRPAMSLKARLAYVKEVPAGCGIGYGPSYVTPKASKIATLPLGYADGYPRALTNRASVGLRGGRAGIVGRICMDQCMIDVSGIPGAEEGDEAVLFGKGGPSVSEIAAMAGTIPNELLSRVGKRLPRRYQNGSI